MRFYKTYILYLSLIFIMACNQQQTDVQTASDSTPVVVGNEDFKALNVPWSVIKGYSKLPFTDSFQYGSASQQFGELRMPETAPPTGGKYPVAVFIHGGCWMSEFSLDHVSQVCADLQRRGYAVWTPEYRRVGDEGGGFPNTFLDASLAVDHLRTIADAFPIDLDKVTVLGHSAGGHLALWMAGRTQIPDSSALFVANPLAVHRVVALAPITDLAAYDEVKNSCSKAVQSLMGGDVSEYAERYHWGSPTQLVPAGVETFLVHGTADKIVPLAQSIVYRDVMAESNVQTSVVQIDGGGHFDMVAPNTVAWKAVVDILGN